jgi:hypothetical protein
MPTSLQDERTRRTVHVHGVDSIHATGDVVDVREVVVNFRVGEETSICARVLPQKPFHLSRV